MASHTRYTTKINTLNSDSILAPTSDDSVFSGSGPLKGAIEPSQEVVLSLTTAPTLQDTSSIIQVSILPRQADKFPKGVSQVSQRTVMLSLWG